MMSVYGLHQDDLFQTGFTVRDGAWQGCPEWLMREVLPDSLFPDWTREVPAGSAATVADTVQKCGLAGRACLGAPAVLHDGVPVYPIVGLRPFAVNAHFAWMVMRRTPRASWWISEPLPMLYRGEKTQGPVLVRVAADGERLAVVALVNRDAL